MFHATSCPVWLASFMQVWGFWATCNMFQKQIGLGFYKQGPTSQGARQCRFRPLQSSPTDFLWVHKNTPPCRTPFKPILGWWIQSIPWHATQAFVLGFFCSSSIVTLLLLAAQTHLCHLVPDRFGLVRSGPFQENES